MSDKGIDTNDNQNFTPRAQLTRLDITNEIEMIEVPRINKSSRTFSYPLNVKYYFDKAMTFKRKSPEPSITSSNEEQDN